MNDNNTPNVEIESTRDGYRVTVNGKPVTAPLPRLDAAREQGRIERALKNGPPTRRGMFPLIISISVVAGLILFAITGDLSTGILAFVGFFVGTSISFLWFTS